MTIRPPHAAASLALGALLIASIAFAQQAGVRPVASVRQIMDGLVTPASDAVFAVSEAPKSDAEWAAVERQAAVLAESGNLLMLGPRVRDNDAWMTEARGLVDAAAKAADAAHAKNLEALLEASDAVGATCYSCHETYLPKP
jgi:cytochrome c556